MPSALPSILLVLSVISVYQIHGLPDVIRIGEYLRPTSIDRALCKLARRETYTIFCCTSRRFHSFILLSCGPLRFLKNIFRVFMISLRRVALFSLSGLPITSNVCRRTFSSGRHWPGARLSSCRRENQLGQNDFAPFQTVRTNRTHFSPGQFPCIQTR